MARKRHSAKQIIGKLREAGALLVKAAAVGFVVYCQPGFLHILLADLDFSGAGKPCARKE